MSIQASLLFAIVVSLVPKNATAEAQDHASKAQELLRTKQPDRAIAEYRSILAADPGNVDALGNLGVVLFFEGKYSEAADQIRAALTIKPAIPRLQALLGMSEKRLGQMSNAQTDLTAALPQIQERKLHVQTGMELIEVDYSLSQLDKAAEVVNGLRQLEPANIDILYTAHRLYSDLSDETTLSLAMLAPDSSRMHQVMAHELARQAKNKESIGHYRAALKLEPSRSDLHFELAEMLNTSSSTADQQEAKKEYEDALAQNPLDEKAICRLADFASKHADLKTAEANFQRALALQPNDPEANLGLAKVLIAAHRQQEALPYLQRSVQSEPFNPTAHYRLGILDRELGRSEDARRELSEFAKLKKMRNRLQQIYEGMRLDPGRYQQGEPDVPDVP